ncbi:unnamed protein product [Penicillium palitans]
MPSFEDTQSEARLLLVSNRLPITIKRSEDGKYDFSISSGGLVSGLSGLSKSTTFQWYGWPGLEVPETEISEVKQRLKNEYDAVPVFIDDNLADRHYNGFLSKVVLVQIAVLSRQDIEEYQNLRIVVNELIGRINGKFGTVEYTPIHFIHKSVNFDKLIALYAVSDAYIVSSTRDRMNLVAYGYIASQQKRHGVMCLSEFAGAAQSLNGSIIFNPWNSDELADAYRQAVSMDDEQRAFNFAKLDKYVSKNSSAFWGQSFVTELTRISARSGDKSPATKLTLGKANGAGALVSETAA